MNMAKQLIDLKSKIILGNATSLEKYRYFLLKNGLIKGIEVETKHATKIKQDALTHGQKRVQKILGGVK